MKQIYNKEQLMKDIIRLCLCRGIKVQGEIYVCRIGLVTISYDKVRKLISLKLGARNVPLTNIDTSISPGSVILQSIVDLEDSEREWCSVADLVE